ncbi:MAG: hypothetical protein MUQ62_06320 [Reinekea forsetii]|nr:hypothetical protein [Reinekea forsetii]
MSNKYTKGGILRIRTFCQMTAVAIALVSCDRNVTETSFLDSLYEKIGSEQSVQLEAREVYGGAWSRICFKRNNNVSLKFYSDEGKVYQLEFRANDLFIDEEYVEGSLSGMCLFPNQKIKITKFENDGSLQIVLNRASEE